MKKIITVLLFVGLSQIFAGWSDKMNVGTVYVATNSSNPSIKFSTVDWNKETVTWYVFNEAGTELTSNEKAIMSLLLTAQTTGNQIYIDLDTDTDFKAAMIAK